MSRVLAEIGIVGREHPAVLVDAVTKPLDNPKIGSLGMLHNTELTPAEYCRANGNETLAIGEGWFH